jgi:hypothetical protein
MKKEESKKIIKEIQFIYFMIFLSYFLTLLLYTYELSNPPILSFILKLVGIATTVYGFLIILSDFIEFYQKRKNTR